MTATPTKYKNKLTEEIVEAMQFRDLEEGTTSASLIAEWATALVRRVVHVEGRDKLLIETPNGWSSLLKGDYLVWVESEQDFASEGPVMFESLYDEVIEKEESNLVKHARRELKAIGEEEGVIEGYLRVVQAYADMGHSGGSHSVAHPTLMALLDFKNLGPLTDDPEEWFYHGPDYWDGTNGIWQNKRNGEAFSNDGGKTYNLLSERSEAGDGPLHTSVTK